ncbi:MAG: hypothetical protein IJC33_06325 [Clostridia bacterium]|nr:hypothetical protein [Clostridia bacterium]
MVYVCVLIALIIMTLAIVWAVKKRTNTSKWISCVLIGILCATFFMVLPTEWVKEGKEVLSKPLYTVLSALLYSFKALGGRQDIAQLESVALDGVLKTVYICVSYVMFALAPILASSLVLSCIGDMGERMRYLFSRSKKCCVFSEINENSLALAEGIAQGPDRKTLVFCGTKSTDKDHVEKAKKLGAILLHKSADQLRLGRRFQAYEFYFLSEKEEKNIELTEGFILKRDALQKYEVTICSFVQNKANIHVMESMVAKKPCAVFESTHEVLLKKAATIRSRSPKTELVFFGVSPTDREFARFAQQYAVTAYEGDWQSTELDDRYKGYDINLYYPRDEKDESGKTKTVAVSKGLGYRNNHLIAQWQEEPLKIRFIDEIALFCNNHLFEHPLYDLPAGRKDISVLLVGCGRLGMQMLKSVLWCGQIKGYTLKVRVLDKKAIRIEKEFRAQCPEMDHYDVAFEYANVENNDFEAKIQAHADATFICVATGSDELNVSTAETIHSILRRKYIEDTPPIFARVRKSKIAKNFEEKGSYLDERNISLFGTAKSIYANKALFHSDLENLALAVHLCYNWALDQPKDSFAYKKALYDYCTSEYARRSSMAAALHIGAKIRGAGITTAGPIPTEEELSEFVRALEDKGLELALTENEHKRWNAFMRSEGFRKAAFEEVKQYAPYTRTHKDEVAKWHPCIVPWAELDGLQEQYNALQKELNLKPSDFKEYDRKIVVETPQIIQRANKLCKEGW